MLVICLALACTVVFVRDVCGCRPMCAWFGRILVHVSEYHGSVYRPTCVCLRLECGLAWL